MERKLLKDIIWERLEVKGYDFEKALQLTEIPKHYLEIILRGDWSKMPAAPYTRGYLKKIEAVLDFESDHLWQLYQEENEIKSSGAEDKLPENRYAIKSKNHKWVWPTVVAAIVLIYFFFNVGRLLGQPNLNVINPSASVTTTANSIFTISGEADTNDKLFINQEEIYIDKDGQFQEQYNLQPGLNTFELVAKKFLGKEIKVVKQIIYQPITQ